MYLEEELEAAIESARKVINSRAISAERYIRGYNDCFAFLLEYERALRGEKSLTRKITLTYNDSVEFMSQLHKQLGYSNLLKFAIGMKFKPVRERKPITGDIAFDFHQGVGTAMIAERTHWVSTDESNKGVRPRRKFLAKEILIDLHARPVYLGE